jgi:type IV pilus assembly protein PilY1
MMKAFKLDRLSLLLAMASALGFTSAVHAQVVINDTLTGASSSYDWAALNGACLTAGTSFTISSNSKIPACRVGTTNLSYYSGKTLVGGATGTLPDADGQGALRLTNGDTTTGSNGNNQTGAVVSNFTFPTNEGLQVTWTSVTYGGNAYPNNHGSTNSDGTAYDNLSGADGISFFLSDGGTTAKPIAPTVGALGGSLGYSCSNGNGTYDGVVGGYLGIGMDEFGNFASKSDNTSSGPGQTAGAITVRGAGHTAFKWLNDNYKSWYPDSLSTNDSARMTAIQTTCRTGRLYNFSGSDVAVTVPGYTANYAYTKSSCSKNCTVTGSITSASTISSPAKCDDSGNPSSSGSHICTYTTIAPATQKVSSGSQIPSNVVGSAYKLDYNYPWLSTNLFPQGSYIFNQEALGADTSGASKAVRGKAKPVTYSLLITQTGRLTFTYSINGGSSFTVFNGMDITASNGPLPSSFRFGFSAGTGGGSNVHEITCFKAAPANVSGSTAGSNVQSGKVQSDSQIYLAYYHPTNSWGVLTAQSLVFDATTSKLSISPTVNWDAGCVLTGGPCLSQGTASDPAPNVAAPLTNTTRTILSWDGTKGVPFRWANMTSSTGGQQAALTVGDATATSDRLDYLRGDRTKEVTGGGAFRNRTSLLGDIVDSSPVWVGPPNLNYGAAWSDLLNPTTTMPEGTSYATFKTTYAGRLNVVYAGANDGMLHGFQAGAYSNGALVQTNNTGKEVLSYVPSQVVSTIHSTNPALDFANPSYSHNFFVDATPATGDLYYGGGWHSWVVSGLGPGGQAGGPVADTTSVATGSVFALEVTDPATFAETAAQTIVKGEWSSASLNASGSLCNVANCGDRLGATYGTPSIRRLHDGTWGVIFGNGLNSKNGTAGIFIVHVDPSTGATQSVQYIDTGSGSTASMNGIVQVTPVDLDGDHVVDYLYAGDLQGHVWRFDLTASSSSSWTMKSTPVFTTQSGQPITTGLAVDAVTTMSDTGALSNQPRLIIAFGTGNKLPQTLTANTSYPSTRQSIYGIWDADMSTWNGKVAAQYQYASLASPPAIVPGSGSSGNMLVHTITTSSSGVRSTDQKVAVCWQDSTACSSATNNQMGWELDLTLNPASGSVAAVAEQVLYNPMVSGHYFNTNTALPTVAQALTCDSSKQSAYSIGISMATGGAGAGLAGTTTTSTSGGTTTVSNNFAYFANYAAGTIGVSTGAVGTSSLVTAQDGTHDLVSNTTDGTGHVEQVNLPPDSSTTGTASRLTWTKMR